MHALAQYPKAEKKPRYSPNPAFAYAYTPASSSGLRTASVWNTNASISIPVPAMTQATSAPKAPVARAKLRGSEKTPAPTIDPTTMAVSVVSENFRTSADARTSVSTEAMCFPPRGLGGGDLLDLESGDAVQHAQGRARVAEDREGEVAERRDAEHGAHIGAA